MKRVILDTDIGSDVDDALALGLVLRSPELKLEAVTTVHGDTRLRAAMVLKLLALAGVENVPVAAGAQRPLLPDRPVYWAGHEGKGLLEEGKWPEPAPIHAVDLIIQKVLGNPGEITLIPIGPLTNVAQALIQEPRLAGAVNEIIAMSGVIRASEEALALSSIEHNVRLDPEAAQIVYGAGVPLTLIGLDVTTQVRITEEGHQRLAQGDALAQALAEQVRLYPRYAARGWTYLHDPLAVAVAIDPSLVRTRELAVKVETRGEYTTGQMIVSLPTEGKGNAAVALEVEAGCFQEFFLERLCT